MADSRPEIENIISGQELRRWYWLKDDLVKHARTLGLKTAGGKFEVLERIANFLDTGEKTTQRDLKGRKTTSGFDWHSAELTIETVITDSYKNTQNVRSFFHLQAGAGFKFNIEFMAWMKANVGKTLGDAVAEYNAMLERMSVPGYQSKIEPHNQFNQYTRDFLEDNPELKMADVRRVWALKRSLPSADGRHVYEKSDLKLEG